MNERGICGAKRRQIPRAFATKRWRIRPKSLCVTNPQRLLAEIHPKGGAQGADVGSDWARIVIRERRLFAPPRQTALDAETRVVEKIVFHGACLANAPANSNPRPNLDFLGVQHE